MMDDDDGLVLDPIGKTVTYARDYISSKIKEGVLIDGYKV
jgi:hypothetical protein